ncbi:MAG: alkaline phosphatase D family protein [Pseudomonadota bacterium]
MAEISRRGALGLAGGLFGLAACENGPQQDESLEADARPAFDGDVSFIHGVASGDPLTESVVLWTRATPQSGEGAIPVRYEVFSDEALTEKVAAGLASADPERDYTVKVVAGALKPGALYRYRFIAKTSKGDVVSPIGRTKTTSAAGVERVNFAVVSCSNLPFGYFNVYKALSERDDLDAILHLGDYFYEYGVDGYGGEAGEALGRRHDPITETVTLDDYRTRHAQYKLDPDLQAAHAAAPWLCTWDDHESTNNSYRTGAQNHNPEENEGDWSDRKQAAVQAYLEWMPVRDPEPGRARESIYRSFDFGDLATVFCLESRLTGRSKEISWFAELGGKAPAEIPAAAMATLQKVNDPTRTMLGQIQEDWLADGLKTSVNDGRVWQVLANQVIMARVKPPRLAEVLTQEQQAAQTNGFIQQLIPFSQLGAPWNLDAWDGFPAARRRLFDSAREAKARLVTVTGDTHTAWANTLTDEAGAQRGVEFGCTSVTSPGLGTYFVDVPELGQLFADANDDVTWYDPTGNGYTLVSLSKDEARAAYFKVSSVSEREFQVEQIAEFKAEAQDDGVSDLSAV